MRIACSPRYGSVHFPPSSFLHHKTSRFIPFHELPILNSFRISGFSSGSRIVVPKLKYSGSSRMSVTSRSGFAGGVDDSEGKFLETEGVLTNGSSSIRRETDTCSWEARINNSSKWVMFVVFSALVIGKHDSESLWATAGAVSNCIISVCLKHLLNHERPMSAIKTDPGMPSSHGQSIFFVGVYAALSLTNWLGINMLTVTLAILAFGCGSYLSWLRVSLGFHTMNQVLVGAIIGSIFSALWFWLWRVFAATAYAQHLWAQLLLIIVSVLLTLGFLSYVFRDWIVGELQVSV